MNALLTVSVRTQLAARRLFVGLEQRRERGDVPGWVLITIMTVGLVAALWTVARGRFTKMFDESVQNVIH